MIVMSNTMPLQSSEINCVSSEEKMAQYFKELSAATKPKGPSTPTIDQIKIHELTQQYLSSDFIENGTMQSNNSISSTISDTTFESNDSNVSSNSFAAQFIKTQLQLKTSKKHEKNLTHELSLKNKQLIIVKKELKNLAEEKDDYRKIACGLAMATFAVLNILLLNDTTA